MSGKQTAKRVTAAVLIDGGRVLIAKRKTGQHLAGFWEFPGGKVEDGETPEEGLARELKEELGIVIKVDALFGESVYHYEQGTIELLGYWATWEDGEITARVHEEVQWAYPGQLGDYTFSPADRPFVEKLRQYRDDSVKLPVR
ncbi:MAG TPA: (deoxy)nucleoside triphosphate pyrophosphohydrolase [Spirochaetia bacterium]|nr:(deoxy)nucleoside triphosphate pyrophosphohydrolase [Spirochaetia bacterium]